MTLIFVQTRERNGWDLLKIPNTEGHQRWTRHQHLVWPANRSHPLTWSEEDSHRIRHSAHPARVSEVYKLDLDLAFWKLINTFMPSEGLGLSTKQTFRSSISPTEYLLPSVGVCKSDSVCHQRCGLELAYVSAAWAVPAGMIGSM